MGVGALDELAGLGEAQAGAGLLARHGIGDLGEGLEDSLLILRVDADAGIRPADLELLTRPVHRLRGQLVG